MAIQPTPPVSSDVSVKQNKEFKMMARILIASGVIGMIGGVLAAIMFHHLSGQLPANSQLLYQLKMGAYFGIMGGGFIAGLGILPFTLAQRPPSHQSRRNSLSVAKKTSGFST